MWLEATQNRQLPSMEAAIRYAAFLGQGEGQQASDS
jgi:hypothetical protein